MMREHEWLQKKHCLSPLSDTSLEGRRQFLEQHEDVLWSFWYEAFLIAISSRDIDPKKALGRSWEGDEREGAHMIADRLIEKLREREFLPEGQCWTNLEWWYSWLVGKQAYHAGHTIILDTERLERETATHYDPQEEFSDEVNGREQQVQALEALVGQWSALIKDVVSGTGIQAIELDWLWATCEARRPVSKLLSRLIEAQEITFPEEFLEARKKNLADRSSTSGSALKDRIKRSRNGAAACFRFNLAALSMGAPQAFPITREVFLGPARSEPPYRPTHSVQEDALEGFQRVLRQSYERSVIGDQGIERLWAEVFSCALQKAVARLLPRKYEETVADMLTKLLQQTKTPNR